MATIREVAKRAGVSIASVSRVMNNDSKYKMTDETRLRIETAIRELDYHQRELKKEKRITNQHTAHSQMLTGRREQKKRIQSRIGCILRITKKKFNDPYYMSILSSIESRLSELGYQISFIKTGAELESKALLQSLFANEVKGVILMEDLPDETYNFIRKACPNIVGIDTHRKDIDNIAYNHYEVAELAVNHLVEKGHKKIGYIGGQGEHGLITCSQRCRGFRYTMESYGLPINEKWILDSEWDEDKCNHLVNELIKTGDYPDAFFVGSDLMAMATLNALYENNIKVPSQVAIASVTDLDITRFSNPPLTTVHIPMDEIGFAAADMLAARMEGYSMLPQRITLPTRLVVRSST